MRSRGGVRATVVGGAALLLALPVFYMLSASLMGPAEAAHTPPTWLPADPRYGNYASALDVLPVGWLMLNSLLVGVVVAAAQVLTSAAAAYALARLRFRGREWVFRAFLATLFVPTLVLVAPRFLLVDRLGWVDTYAGLMVTGLVSVTGIFFLRQCFLTLPRDLEDSARLDGAGEWAVFRRVALPQIRPALVVVGLLALLAQWRSLLWPLVVTRAPELRVAEAGVAVFRGIYGASWPQLMVVAVIVTAPAIVVGVVALSGRLGARATVRGGAEGELPGDVVRLPGGPLEHHIL